MHLLSTLTVYTHALTYIHTYSTTENELLALLPMSLMNPNCLVPDSLCCDSSGLVCHFVPPGLKMGDGPVDRGTHAYSADTVVAMSVAYLSFFVWLVNGYRVSYSPSIATAVSVVSQLTTKDSAV